ncbi:MAG: hypothetical protein ACI8VC_002938 [Candidatus Endobugula sp.]|jgi:hypothetical protein
MGLAFQTSQFEKPIHLYSEGNLPRTNDYIGANLETSHLPLTPPAVITTEFTILFGV